MCRPYLDIYDKNVYITNKFVTYRMLGKTRGGTGMSVPRAPVFNIGNFSDFYHYKGFNFDKFVWDIQFLAINFPHFHRFSLANSRPYKKLPCNIQRTQI